MICHRCNNQNPEVAKFCGRCAAPLGQTQQNAENERVQYVDYEAAPRNRTGRSQGASGRAITAMILSIASLVLCCTFLGVPGMILGKMEMTAIHEGRAPVSGDGFAKTAFYLGIAGTALSLVGNVICLAMFMSSGGRF